MLEKGGGKLKTFEMSKRVAKNGRRKFKLVLHEIYPDNTVDEENEAGTVYNKNGITWISKYCEKAMPTITDMPLRVEFLDEDRTEIAGHGDTGIVDGLPTFENAVEIGHFTKGYIDTVSDDDGEHTVMMGEGFIDEMCYKSFVEKLFADIEDGEYPSCSVEICRTEDNDSIIYKYGYKPDGRIPSEFIYSGVALLGVEAADSQAKLIELNKKEDECQMNESEIKALIEQTINEMASHTTELNECKADCEAKIAEANANAEAKIAEANAAVEAAITEKNEIIANSEKIQAALDELRKEYDELDKKYMALHEERKALEDALGEAKARERLGEMNAALSRFTDEERAYAQEEIDAFTADPISSEINSITDKILMKIGEKAKEAAETHIAEQNSANHETEVDIFGEIDMGSTKVVEDDNIF